MRSAPSSNLLGRGYAAPVAVAGVLLAAGAGTRFGRPKALVSFAGEPLAQRGAAALAEAGCDPVVVVIGAAAERVREALAHAPARVVENPDWATGLASSLRAGLAALPVDAEAAVITLVDQPLVGPAVIRRMVQACAEGAQLAMAVYHGRRAHPVLLGRTHWAGVAESAHGDAGARAYLRRHADDVVEIDCTGLGDPADVDTPDDLATLEARS